MEEGFYCPDQEMLPLFIAVDDRTEETGQNSEHILHVLNEYPIFLFRGHLRYQVASRFIYACPGFNNSSFCSVCIRTGSQRQAVIHPFISKHFILVRIIVILPD